MKKAKHIILKLVVAFAIVATAAGCSNNKQSSNTESNNSRADSAAAALVVGITPTSDCLPALVAVERGIAERHGLSVDLAMFNARMDQDTAITKGRIDGMFADSVNVAYLNSKDKKWLDVCYKTQAEWLLVAGRTSRVSRCEQLGDKIIAHACFSATEWLTEQALKGVKTKADVYKVQVNDVKVRLNMLLEAAVDAAWLPEPYATMALKSGHNKIADSKQWRQKLGVVAFTSKAMADKKKRKDIDLFIKCLDEANDSIKKYGASHYADCIK